MKRPYKRRYLLVDNIQYRLLAITLAHFFVIALFIAAALFLPLILKLENETLSSVEKQAAAAEFLSLHARFWPAMVGVFILLGFHSVLVSHRVAGPLFGFRRTLKEIGEGDLTARATIRRFDYLWKEADSINEMLDGLGGRFRRLQEEYGRAYAMWLQFKDSLPPEMAEELSRRSEERRVGK